MSDQGEKKQSNYENQIEDAIRRAIQEDPAFASVFNTPEEVAERIEFLQACEYEPRAGHLTHLTFDESSMPNGLSPELENFFDMTDDAYRNVYTVISTQYQALNSTPEENLFPNIPDSQNIGLNITGWHTNFQTSPENNIYEKEDEQHDFFCLKLVYSSFNAIMNYINDHANSNQQELNIEILYIFREFIDIISYYEYYPQEIDYLRYVLDDMIYEYVKSYNATADPDADAGAGAAGAAGAAGVPIDEFMNFLDESKYDSANDAAATGDSKEESLTSEETTMLDEVLREHKAIESKFNELSLQSAPAAAASASSAARTLLMPTAAAVPKQDGFPSGSSQTTDYDSSVSSVTESPARVGVGVGAALAPALSTVSEGSEIDSSPQEETAEQRAAAEQRAKQRAEQRAHAPVKASELDAVAAAAAAARDQGESSGDDEDFDPTKKRTYDEMTGRKTEKSSAAVVAGQGAAAAPPEPDVSPMDIDSGAEGAAAAPDVSPTDIDSGAEGDNEATQGSQLDSPYSSTGGKKKKKTRRKRKRKYKKKTRRRKK